MKSENIGKITLFIMLVTASCFFQCERNHAKPFEDCSPVCILKIDTVQITGQSEIYLYHLSDSTLRYIRSSAPHIIKKNDSILYKVALRSDEIEKYQVINN